MPCYAFFDIFINNLALFEVTQMHQRQRQYKRKKKNLLTLFIYLLSLVIKDAKGKTLKQTHTLILWLTHMTYKITIYDNLLFSKCLKDPNFCFYISCSQDGTNISCRA